MIIQLYTWCLLAVVSLSAMPPPENDLKINLKARNCHYEGSIFYLNSHMSNLLESYVSHGCIRSPPYKREVSFQLFIGVCKSVTL